MATCRCCRSNNSRSATAIQPNVVIFETVDNDRRPRQTESAFCRSDHLPVRTCARLDNAPVLCHFFFSLYFCTVSVVSVLVFVAKYETTAGAAHETHTHNCTYANWPHKPSPTTTTIANNIIITLSTLQIYLYFYINECFSLGCCSLSLVFSV